MLGRYSNTATRGIDSRLLPNPPRDGAAELPGCDDPGPDPANLSGCGPVEIEAPTADIEKIFSNL